MHVKWDVSANKTIISTAREWVCSHTWNSDLITDSEIGIKQQRSEISGCSDQKHFVHFCFERPIIRRQCHITEMILSL